MKKPTYSLRVIERHSNQDYELFHQCGSLSRVLAVLAEQTVVPHVPNYQKVRRELVGHSWACYLPDYDNHPVLLEIKPSH